MIYPIISSEKLLVYFITSISTAVRSSMKVESFVNKEKFIDAFIRLIDALCFLLSQIFYHSINTVPQRILKPIMLHKF